MQKEYVEYVRKMHTIAQMLKSDTDDYTEEQKCCRDELILKGLTHDQVAWERDLLQRQIEELNHHFGERSRFKQVYKEMVEEHDDCFDMIMRFNADCATDFEWDFFALVGKIMQTLGYLIDTVKEDYHGKQ